MDNDISSKSTVSKWVGILFAILLPIAAALLIVFLEKKSSTNQTSNYIMTTIPPNRISTTQSPTLNTGSTGATTSNTGARTSNTGASTSNTGATTSNTGAATSNTGAATSNTGAPTSNTGAATSNTGALTQAPTLKTKKWTITVNSSIASINFVNAKNTNYIALHIDFRNDRIVLSQKVTVWGPETYVLGGFHNLARPTRFTVSLTGPVFKINYGSNLESVVYYTSTNQDVNTADDVLNNPQIFGDASFNGPEISYVPELKKRIINKKDRTNCVSSRIPYPGSSTEAHQYLGEFNSYEDCAKYQYIPPNAKAITWHNNDYGEWKNKCYSINDNNTNVEDGGTTCGIITP